MKIGNKRAMFFTILALAILSLFLISYTFYTFIKSREPVTKRVETLNDFVYSAEQDLPRQLYISGFRIIFLFEKKLIDTGKPITDFNESFQEMFYNGTYHGVRQEIMIGANFSGIQKFLSEKARKINADINLTNPSLVVGQDDPWNIKLSLKVDMFVTDRTDLALWNKTSVIDSYIPIDNFEDPLYVLSTNGTVTNKINRTIYEPFVDGVDVTNLSLHVNSENSYYIESTSAPSFLDRLEGINEADENGIESLVYRSKLAVQIDKSVVDYIYFSTQNPTPVYRVLGMPDWFKLSDESLDVYDVRDLAY